MSQEGRGPAINVRGKILGGGGLPLVCTPIVGSNREAILSDLARVLPQKPDLIEWRVDFFREIAKAEEVLRTAHRIREAVGELPILFTVRTEREGGEPISLREDERVQLYRAVCQTQCVDLIDFELNSSERDFTLVREAAHLFGIRLIGSFHDFSRTPAPERIRGEFTQAERLGADVVKVAVMPRELEDVLTLLGVTVEAARTLRIPLITVSMGGYGSLTRLFGWVFGSCVTFAMGEKSSAPGQVPIEELKMVLDIARKAVGGG